MKELNEVVKSFKSLSKPAKVGVVSGVIFFSLAAVSAISGTPQDSTNTNQQAAPEVQEASEILTPEETTEEVVETEAIAFTIETVNDSSLAKGTQTVKREGKDGTRTFVYRVTYRNGIESSRELISNEVTEEPVSKLVAQGTYEAPKPKQNSSCDSNYKGGCVPIVSYDLNCDDIGFRVTVVGYDKHNFDGDGDGTGCEKY